MQLEFKEGVVEDFLNKINRKYGYDFANYARASIIRRIQRFINNQKISGIEELQKKVLKEEIFFQGFVEQLTVNVTEMFRDPKFFLSLRKNVFPDLQFLPTIKLWDAGCSSGEELYSLAILLKEEELYNRSLLFATDLNQKVLNHAKAGKYQSSVMEEYGVNYKKAGGRKELSKYYLTKNGVAHIDNSLKRNLVFSSHNLAHDGSFNEFDLIICRNVLIYFNKDLQNRVLKLFLDSLKVNGFLALGNKESLFLTAYNDMFELVDKKEKIYRRLN